MKKGQFSFSGINFLYLKLRRSYMMYFKTEVQLLKIQILYFTLSITFRERLFAIRMNFAMVSRMSGKGMTSDIALHMTYLNLAHGSGDGK